MALSRLLLIIAPVLISGLFLTSSCEKDIELTPSPVDSYPEKSFYAIVGPNEFIDTILWAEDDGSLLTITATSNGENEYPRIILKMPNDISLGSHGMGGPQSDNPFLIEFGSLPDQKFQAIDSTGVLVITNHLLDSKLMMGKFICTVKPSSGNPSIPNIDVWSGNFVITY